MKIPPEIMQNNIPLAPQTTMHLGGPARYFAECTSVAEIRTALEWAAAENLPVQILGGGSNVLFPDTGYSGLVLKVALSGIEFADATATVAAGENWDPFVQQCVERGLAGVECLSGIPGLVGATPIQNVGAYGQEVQDTIIAVQALDRENLAEVTFTNTQCRFAYRQSRFKAGDRDRHIITAVTYLLDPSGQPQIRYPELRRHIGDELDGLAPGRPALSAVRNTVLKLRRNKSMVIDPQDPNARSVGSFFLNPVITAGAFATIEQQHPDVPHFPAPDGVKVPAAWLVEQAGFHKGLKRGGAGISDHHALALVNRSGTTREILALAAEIQDAVETTFGIRLEREPVLIEET
ncbi:MAG: UDP-N-acetylmuramate dehydrogenase [Candidatus Latescibacterota bacterium]|nr:UDP-N-acetylmuramate dehydrogenase [Candidatus Latescibacterota bacterium]